MAIADPPGLADLMSAVEELIGVYDADGTAWGELSYWIGARLGRRHCALCDITHGSVRERDDWVRCRDDLPVPFRTYHRDDQPADVREATGGAVPVVAARTTDGVRVLLGRAEIEGCDGSPPTLVARVDDALSRLGLHLE